MYRKAVQLCIAAAGERTLRVKGKELRITLSLSSLIPLPTRPVVNVVFVSSCALLGVQNCVLIIPLRPLACRHQFEVAGMSWSA